MANGELQVEVLASEPCGEPVFWTRGRQSVAKILTPADFDFGLSPGQLSRYRYQRDELILCRRNTEEWVRWLSPIQLLVVTLPDEALAVAAEESGHGNPKLIETSHLEDDRVRALMTAVEAEHRAGSHAGRVYMDSVAQALAAALLQTRGAVRTPRRQVREGLAPAQLRRVVEFVRQNLEADLSLAQMANAAGLSSAYFSQMFRKATGLAPHQFVLDTRVNHAKELLRAPGSRVLDVAIACGFQTQQHFSRVFHTRTGATPTGYRRAVNGTTWSGTDEADSELSE